MTRSGAHPDAFAVGRVSIDHLRLRCCEARKHGDTRCEWQLRRVCVEVRRQFEVAVTHQFLDHDRMDSAREHSRAERHPQGGEIYATAQFVFQRNSGLLQVLPDRFYSRNVMAERLGKGIKIHRTKPSQGGCEFGMQRTHCFLPILADRSRQAHPWLGVIQEEIRLANLIQLFPAKPGIKCGRIDHCPKKRRGSQKVLKFVRRQCAPAGHPSPGVNPLNVPYAQIRRTESGAGRLPPAADFRSGSRP